MKNVRLKDHLHYRFDRLMSRGTGALILWLSLATVALVTLIAILVKLTPEGQPLSLVDVMWLSLMRTLDPGTMGDDRGGWSFLLLMLVITMGGIFIVGALIGIITTGLDEKLSDLRKGRSFVVEENHTVILGWSAQIYPIISELVIANENQRSPRIVILAKCDKVEMEDEIRAKVRDTKNTRVICRTGDPMDLRDLEIINPHLARSIIILSPEDNNPDTQVIKSILAITNNPNRRPDPYHIVASIHDPKNMEAAHLVSRGEAQIILANELLSRITAQTCRQSGLSVVYTELLDFQGDEIYFAYEPELVGSTFGEAIFSYEDSTVIGIRYHDGRVLLNPPMDSVIQAEDQIIAISEDDDTVVLSAVEGKEIDASAIAEGRPQPRERERTLILGWNQRASMIINELDRYVPPGSEVLVVADIEDGQAVIAYECDSLENQSVGFQQGDITSRRTLDQLGVDAYDYVIVLSYPQTLTTQASDARTLVTLLHLREIADKNNPQYSIVSEMLDMRNRELADITRADDFIVSDNLISLMLSQVSENKDLMEVFTDLFDPDGAEIYLKAAEDYVRLGVPVNFYTVLEAARQRDEVAIGYRLAALENDASQMYGVFINPKKSQMITFSNQDRVIVLAED